MQMTRKAISGMAKVPTRAWYWPGETELSTPTRSMKRIRTMEVLIKNTVDTMLTGPLANHSHTRSPSFISGSIEESSLAFQYR